MRPSISVVMGRVILSPNCFLRPARERTAAGLPSLKYHLFRMYDIDTISYVRYLFNRTYDLIQLSIANKGNPAMHSQIHTPSPANVANAPLALQLPAETGDWGADNRAGRAAALALISRMHDREAPFLLGHLMKELIAIGRYCGVEVGFCQQIAEKALGLRLRTADEASDPDELRFDEEAEARPPKNAPARSRSEISDRPRRATTLREEDELLRLLRLPEVMRLTGLSCATLYRNMKLGHFPRPLKQGRISTWRKADVTAYLDRLSAVQ